MTENKNLENIPLKAEEPWQLEERMRIHHTYKKSRYPPMNIEPLPYVRQRLAGQGMTPEERALRKQWIMDQRLHPSENPSPVIALEMNYPEPMNPIKRMIRFPMDVTFRMLTPVLGPKVAGVGRAVIPKLFLGLFASWAIIYHMRYSPNTWEHTFGWAIYGEKERTFGYKLPDKEASDFADRGFKSRKALKDGKTSFNSEMAS